MNRVEDGVLDEVILDESQADSSEQHVPQKRLERGDVLLLIIVLVPSLVLSF